MAELFLWFGVLVVALAVLLKGADIFVERAAEAARALGVPQVVVGVSLVALGTSLPELAAALFSAFTGAGEFVAGTVIGSNVANITFILGCAALAFRGFAVSPQLMGFDMPVMLLAAFLLGIMSINGQIGLGEGILLLACYGLYMVQIVKRGGQGADKAEGGFRPVIVLWLIGSAAGIYFGAQYTVESVVQLTRLLGLEDTSVLALTVVAVGSSLPELVVTLAAAKKKYYDLSVGNVVGSNICNSFLVMGAPAMVKTLPVTNAVMLTGVPFMLAASLMIMVFGMRGNVGRTSGLFLLVVFIYFLGQNAGLM